ncbi:MAG: hypothetical protein ACFB4I_05985 [Cyanophyceae cyanobacterium]
MSRAYLVTFRLAAGLAVGFWGVSKLFFVSSWVVTKTPFTASFPSTPLCGYICLVSCKWRSP